MLRTMNLYHTPMQSGLQMAGALSSLANQMMMDPIKRKALQTQTQGMQQRNALAALLQPTQVDMAKQQDLAQQLANQKSGALLPLAVPAEKSRISLQNAQALQLGDPLHKLTGAQGAYELAKQKWGENDPRTQEIKKYSDAQTKLQIARGEYFASNKELKNLTSQAKNAILANNLQNLSSFNGNQQTTGGVSQPVSGTQQPLQPQQGNVPQAVQEATQGALEKGLRTTKDLDAQRAAVQLDSLLQQAVPIVSSVSKYAGYKGSIQKLMDKIKASSGGKVTPEYSALQQMMIMIPEMIGQMRTMYGNQATDQETKNLKIVTSLSQLKHLSTQQFIDNYNRLSQMASRASKNLAKTPYQRIQMLKKNAANPVVFGGTQQQVNIPSFGSKDEFQRWFNQQPTASRQTILKQLNRGK